MSTPAECVKREHAPISSASGCRRGEPSTRQRDRGLQNRASSLLLVYWLVFDLGARSAGAQQAAAPATPAPPATQAPKAPLTAEDGLPGSPRPIGPGLSPEAPSAPAAPGGRAPSFGAPTDKDVWSFRFGGRISGYESIGFGSRPGEANDSQSSTTLHIPGRVRDARLPFDSGGTLNLNLSYGSAIVGAFVNYTVNTNGREYASYYNANGGANANSAYLNITPQSLGNVRLAIKVGAFTDSFGGVGQWGWGIFGPLLGVRGYGESIAGEYDLTPDLRLSLQHGVFVVPGVPEFFVRGTYTGWNETGVSTMLQHGHVGLSYQGKYVIRLHAANASGTDEREILAPVDPAVPADMRCLPPNVVPPGCESAPRDGRMDVLAVETHTFLNQWGQFGLSAAYYNLVTANPIHDGIWWTADWTQGARETTNAYIGPTSGGTGSFYAISAQYDFSLASVMWHPKPFDGRTPDLRAAIAGIYHKTLTTDDRYWGFDKAHGYQAGLELDYRMLPWLSATLRGYGKYTNKRAQFDNGGNSNVSPGGGTGSSGQIGNVTAVRPFFAGSITPGLSFRSDWQAPERIEIAYSRMFYNDFADSNPQLPLDKDVITVGASLSF